MDRGSKLNASVIFCFELESVWELVMKVDVKKYMKTYVWLHGGGVSIYVQYIT